MNATISGHQLYPASRLRSMNDFALMRVLAFAKVDRDSTWVTYDGMSRDETVLTAQRTIDDVTAAQERQATVRFWSTANLAFL